MIRGLKSPSSFYAGRIYRITTERSSVEVSGKEEKNFNAARTLECSVCKIHGAAIWLTYRFRQHWHRRICPLLANSEDRKPR